LKARRWQSEMVLRPNPGSGRSQLKQLPLELSGFSAFPLSAFRFSLSA
jgi:hypothetical protein